MPVVIGVERRCRLRKELLAHLGVKPGQRLDVEVLPGGRLELHAEQATGTIAGFLQEAIETGWAGLPCGERKP